MSQEKTNTTNLPESLNKETIPIDLSSPDEKNQQEAQAYADFCQLVAINKQYSLEEQDLVDLCKDDPLLSKNLCSFREIEQESTSLITSMQRSWTHYGPPKDHEPLTAELNRAGAKLTNLNDYKGKLRGAILARQQFLTPRASTLDDLQFELNEDKKSLHRTLEHFLMIFTAIDLGNSVDQEALYFSSQLQQFIKAIAKDLKAKEIPLNRSAWRSPRSLKQDEISGFLSDLFDRPADEVSWLDKTKLVLGFSAEDKEGTNLKRQIIALRRLDNKIAQFPIAATNNYSALKTTQDDQAKRIADKKHSLQTTLSSLEEKLVHQLNRCNREKADQEPVIADAHEMLAGLQKLKLKLSKLLAAHEERMAPLATIESPFDHSTKMINEQNLVITALEKMEQKLEGKEGLDKASTEALKALDRFYNLERDKLISLLDNSLKEAEAILYACYQDQALVKRMLQDEVAGIEGLKSEQEKTLVRIGIDARVYIKRLKNSAGSIRGELVKNYEGIINSIEMMALSVQPEFSAANPFKAIFNEKEEAILQTLRQVKEELRGLEGNEIKACLDKVEKGLLLTQQAVKERGDLLKNALVINERLGSEEHKTSLEIITTLEKQYSRLIDENMGEALSRHSSKSMGLKKTQENPTAFLSLEKLNANQVNALTRIDPRLPKLWSIRDIFRQINSEYINRDLVGLKQSVMRRMLLEYRHIFNAQIGAALEKNPNSSSALLKLGYLPGMEVLDETKAALLDLIDPRLANLYRQIWQLTNSPPSAKELYIDLLLNEVETHIHNDQMEHFSDGERSEFIQLIRLYILKPLQVLKQKLSSFFSKESSNKHSFILTIGATDTELTLAEIGEQATRKLSNI